MSTAPAAAPAAAPSASSSPAPSSSSAPSTSSSPPPSASSSSSSGTPDVGAPGQQPTGTSEAKANASAEQAAKAEAERKWKLKVNGQERELTEAELIRRASLGYGAEEKLQKAQQERQMAEQFFQALKSDPLAVLTHPDLGLNFREMAEQYLSKEIQMEMMSPEQRELEQLRSFKREQEEAVRRAQEQEMTVAQQRTFQEQMQRTAKEYDTKITEVLKATDLPKTAYTVKRVAELMKGALQKGYDLDVETAVDMVREGYNTDFKSLFGNLKGESLVKFMGEDVIKELRQYDLARLRAKLDGAAAPQPTEQQVVPPTPRRTAEEAPKMRMDQWLEEARKKAGV